MTFKYNQFDSISDELAKLEGDIDNIKKELYAAAAPVVIGEWKEQLKACIMPRNTLKHSIRRGNKKYKYLTKSTGQLVESVSANVKKGYADIYPKGEDSKGVRNAEKAFILNYGRKNMLARNFIENIDKNLEEEEKVLKAMENKFDEILRKKGLI